MNQIVNIHAKTNAEVTGHLSEFPYYTIKCKLGRVMKDRGIRLQELSDLTGIRIATLSELANMKRTAVNIPHLLVIAKALRLIDIGELFEFVMPQTTHDAFLEDRKEIERQGLLSKQYEILHGMREKRKNPPPN